MRRSKRINKSSVVRVDNLSRQWEPQQIPDAAQPNSVQTQLHVIPQMPRQVQQNSLESDTVGSHPFQLQSSAGFIPAIMTRRKRVQKSLVDHVSQLWQSQHGHEEAQVSSDPDQPQFRHPIPREAQAICGEPHAVDPHPYKAQVSEASTKCTRQVYKSVDNMGDNMDQMQEPQQIPLGEQSSSDQEAQLQFRHQIPGKDQLNSIVHHEVVPLHSNPQAMQPSRLTSESLVDDLINNLNQQQQSQRRPCQRHQNFGETQTQHQSPRRAESSSVMTHTVYPNSTKPDDSSDSADQLPRGRGPTKHNEIWNSSERLRVEFNKKGQPIGRWGRKLSSFLGTIARNGHMLALTYHDWRAVPLPAKKNAWLLVLTKFELDVSRRKTIMESLACKWRNWKSKLKTHYYKHASDDLIVERDDRVIEEQWLALINYWNSDEGKKQSMTNKANRAKVKTYHTGGSRSFAQICEIEREKMPDGEEPSRAKIFILTHTRKDGQPVDATSATVISQLNELMSHQPENSLDPPARDDIFSQVMGTDKEDPSTYWTGIETSNLRGQPGTEGELTRASKAKQLADKEICKMRNKMEAMEENQKMMRDKMEAMEQNEKMLQDRVEAMEQDEKMTQDKMAAMEQDQRMMKENQLRMELKYASIQGQVDMMVETMLRNNTNVHLADHMSTGQDCSTSPLAGNQQHKNNKKQNREDCFTPSLAGNDQQKNNKRQRAEVRRKGQA